MKPPARPRSEVATISRCVSSLPVPVEEQVVSIFAGTRGYLDRVDIADVVRFEQLMLSELRAKHPELVAAIRNEGEVSEATDKALSGFLDDYARTFA